METLMTPGETVICANCHQPLADGETPAAYYRNQPLCQPCALEYYE